VVPSVTGVGDLGDLSFLKQNLLGDLCPRNTYDSLVSGTPAQFIPGNVSKYRFCQSIESSDSIDLFTRSNFIGMYNIEKKVDSDAEDEDEDDEEFGGGAKKADGEEDPVLQAKAMAEAQMNNMKQQAEKCVVQ